MLEHEKNIVRMVSEGFVAWCADTSPAARLERTIAQGLIGVAIGFSRALSVLLSGYRWV